MRSSALPTATSPVRRLARLCAGAALTTLLACTASIAHADIYGYVDADGTAHVATEKLDERYRLFLRGNASFNSNDIGKGLPDLQPGAAASPLLRYMAQHPALKKYEAMVNRSAREYSVEPALLNAIMAAESGFNPSAVSPKGAIGLMQIMPETAARYGVQGDKRKTIQQKLTDPQINIRLAARYLRDLQNLFPARLELAIASYNAGEGAVQKYRNQVPPYPETRNYVQLVAQFYRLYQPAGVAAVEGSAGGGNNGIGIGGRHGRVQMIIPGRQRMPAADTSIE